MEVESVIDRRRWEVVLLYGESMKFFIKFASVSDVTPRCFVDVTFRWNVLLASSGWKRQHVTPELGYISNQIVHDDFAPQQ